MEPLARITLDPAVMGGKPCGEFSKVYGQISKEGENR